MINKIIASYLAGGKRLVIPQFGAFIHKEGDGTVVFVPFLKKDDGVLVDLLCKEYGLDEADARGIITEYIAQIGAGIAERGSFFIEGVGHLKADANGIYFLEYDPGAGTAAGQGTSASLRQVPVAGGGAASAVVPEARPVASDKEVSAGSSSNEMTASEEGTAATSVPKPQAPVSGRDVVREAYYGSSSGMASTTAPRGTAPSGASSVQTTSRPVVSQSPASSPHTVATPGASSASGMSRPVAPSSPVGNSGAHRPAPSVSAGTQGMPRPVTPQENTIPSGAGRPVTATNGAVPSGTGRPVQSAASSERPVYPQRPGTAPAGAGMARPGAQTSTFRGPSGAASMPQRPGQAPYGQPRPEAFGGASAAPGAEPSQGGSDRRNYAGNRPPVGGRPGRPMPPHPVRPQTGKSDKFMIIAILAAVVALASIVYGVMSSSDGPMINPMELPAHHNPAQDSLSTGSDSTGNGVVPAAQAPATK